MEPILGQECVTADYGLGRVTDLCFGLKNKIGVTPYVAWYEMLFDVYSLTSHPGVVLWLCAPAGNSWVSTRLTA